MIDYIDARNSSYADYGCAARGNMDTYKPTIGQPVDVIDKSLNSRKQCIQYASQKFGMQYQPYHFHLISNKLIFNLQNYFSRFNFTAQRAFCECDLQFTEASLAMDPTNGRYDWNECNPVQFNGHNNK